MLTFNENKLVELLNALPAQHRVAFAASCSERLIHNYTAFVAVEHWGNSALLEQGLKTVWAFLESSYTPREQVRALIQSIEQVIPDSEDFHSLFTEAAQNAAIALIHSLECVLDGDTKQAALAGRAVVESITSYLILVNTITIPEVKITHPDLTHDQWAAMHSSFSQWLEQSPLMVLELEKQKQDIETLQSCENLTSAFLESLRLSSRSLGLQPFRRGIVKVSSITS
ncbi:MAG: DUF416 family protein [Chloroflexi bacterium]|nr:DUF416 family protein [Chloroflexota bacterium]